MDFDFIEASVLVVGNLIVLEEAELLVNSTDRMLEIGEFLI